MFRSMDALAAAQFPTRDKRDAPRAGTADEAAEPTDAETPNSDS
ncbi:hypothetical protein [Brachybacterium avium]|nr:hypothetical protein [Brachybacterium avium]